MAIQDYSQYGHTGSLTNTAFISTTQSKFGAGSLHLKGGNDYTSVPDSTDWVLGTDDFTIDLWWRMGAGASAGSSQICSRGTGATDFLSVYLDQGPGYQDGGRTIGLASQTGGGWDIWIRGTFNASVFTVNTWHHVAIVRNSMNFYFYFNGNLGTNDIGAGATSGTIHNSASDLRVGNTTTVGWTFQGDSIIDEFRISKGIARWTATFSPPTSAY